VIDTAMVRVSPEAYNTAVETYKHPIVGVMEVGLVAAVLFHALNGIRIVLVDFWSSGPRYQRQMSYGVVGLFLVLFVPFVWRHLTNVFGG
jgi:succinate dehydrogenase / fumarate reductase, cytochrome b subunit